MSAASLSSAALKVLPERRVVRRAFQKIASVTTITSAISSGSPGRHDREFRTVLAAATDAERLCLFAAGREIGRGHALARCRKIFRIHLINADEPIASGKRQAPPQHAADDAEERPCSGRFRRRGSASSANATGAAGWSQHADRVRRIASHDLDVFVRRARDQVGTVRYQRRAQPAQAVPAPRASLILEVRATSAPEVAPELGREEPQSASNRRSRARRPSCLSRECDVMALTPGSAEAAFLPTRPSAQAFSFRERYLASERGESVCGAAARRCRPRIRG